MTKNNVAPQPSEPKVLVDHKYIRKLGATPKDTKLLKESSSAPKFDPLLSFLANQPSKKSNIVANKIKYIAISHPPFNEKLIEVNPLLKERRVIKFGTYLLIIFCSLILI